MQTTQVRYGALEYIAFLIIVVFALGAAAWLFRPDLMQGLGQPRAVVNPPVPTAITVPTVDPEIARLRAELAAQQAQNRTVFQPKGDEQVPPLAPAPAAPAPSTSGQPQTAPAPAPQVVIVHRVDGQGGQVVTGSGACKVARNVARRCS